VDAESRSRTCECGAFWLPDPAASPGITRREAGGPLADLAREAHADRPGDGHPAAPGRL